MRLPAQLMLLTCSAALASCGTFSDLPEVMPARSEEYSYQGPGGNYVMKGKFPSVVFPSDSAALSESEARKMRAVAQFANAGSKPMLILAGFAPEVGTEEYNRMLGEQRAQAVRAELLALGVKPDQIQTVSYGRESGGRKSEDEGRRVEIGVVE